MLREINHCQESLEVSESQRIYNCLEEQKMGPMVILFDQIYPLIKN